MGGDATKEPPFFFTKPADADRAGRAAGGRAASRYPLATKNFHHEIELVVAIGKARRQASPPSSANDAGLRLCGRPRHDAPRPAERHAREEAAVGHRQVVRAGGADRADPSAWPTTGILSRGAIRLDVNGSARQTGDLADMIWDVPHTLAFLSQYYELLPGDLVFTGTPAGVGAGGRRRPARRQHRRPDAAVDRHRAAARLTCRWRSLTPPKFVERGYNNRAAVPDHPRWFARCAAMSTRRARRARAAARPALRPRAEGNARPVPAGGAARAARSCSSTAATGARSTRPTSRSSPRRSSRRASRSQSSTTTSVPRVTIATIVDECRRAVAWLAREGAAARRHGDRMVVGGHSAGGHLVAMMFATDWPARGLDAHAVRRRRVAVGRARSRAAGRCRRSTRTCGSTPRRRARCRPFTCGPRSQAPLCVAVRRRRNVRVRAPDAAHVGRVAAQSPAGRRRAARRSPARDHFSVVADYADADSAHHRADAGAVLTPGRRPAVDN